MHIHTISTSGMWLYVKLAMTLQPELSSFQLLFLRSVFATLLAWLVVNKNIPDVMWHSIPEESFKMIIIRSSVNFVNLNLIYHANKNFKMSTV